MRASLNLGPPKDLGDQPSFEATFRDEPLTANPDDFGELVDPDALSFVHRLPTGTETEYEWTVDDEVTKIDIGVYRLKVPVLTLPGKHYVRVKSTAGIVTAEEGWFLVRRSEFTAP